MRTQYFFFFINERDESLNYFFFNLNCKSKVVVRKKKGREKKNQKKVF